MRCIHSHSALVLFLAVVPEIVFSQGADLEMPENARAISYGNGWECIHGYRIADEACVAINVPEHAYPTNKSYGRGWECERGYRETGDTCVAIEVPPNGYLDSSGDGWKCERGYRAADKGKTCDAVNISENAHLDYSGDGWDCNQPYCKQQNKCVLL